MNHTINISTETIEAIARLRQANADFNAIKDSIAKCESTLLLPSGRARKGGRKEMQDLEAVREEKLKVNMTATNEARHLLKKDVMVYIKNRCIDAIAHSVSTIGIGSLCSVFKAAEHSLTNGSTETISIDINQTGTTHEYDIVCSYQDYSSGLTICISRKGEGRSLGGGIVNVRRNRPMFRFNDEKFSVINQFINDNGTALIVGVPPSYLDGAYYVTIDGREDCGPGDAYAIAHLVNTCADICRYLNGNLRVECFNHAVDEIVYK